MDDERSEVCSNCRFLEYRQCHRNAPISDFGDWQEAVLAWLFKLYWKDDEEIEDKSIHDIMGNYTEVNFQCYAHWPMIERPDEEWCGEWKPIPIHRPAIGG